MIRFFTLLSACLILTSQATAYIIQKDDEGVRKLLSDYVDAWNTHDSKKMVERWTPEATLINPWGKLAAGKDQVEQVFAEEQKGPLGNLTMKQEINHAFFASPKIAFVDATAIFEGVVPPEIRDTFPVRWHIVYLAVKENDVWYIEAARPYVLPKPVEKVQ